ncbi:MAG: hypothetical protein ACP5HJ_03535 [Candidatus Micrarchaeia archaeon]|jgi:predicted KAP-like P-loop ATPase
MLRIFGIQKPRSTRKTINTIEKENISIIFINESDGQNRDWIEGIKKTSREVGEKEKEDITKLISCFFKFDSINFILLLPQSVALTFL